MFVEARPSFLSEDDDSSTLAAFYNYVHKNENTSLTGEIYVKSPEPIFFFFFTFAPEIRF